MSSKTRRFESLQVAVPDALVGTDQAGVVRFVNRQMDHCSAVIVTTWASSPFKR